MPARVRARISEIRKTDNKEENGGRLNRQLSPFISKMVPRWVSRYGNAAVVGSL